MVRIDGACEKDDIIWFVGNEDNILYCMDKSYNAKMVSIIPADIDRYRANPICINDEQNIYMLPDKAKKIYMYDMMHENITEIPVDLPCTRYSIQHGWVVNGVLWCISNRVGELIKCNISSRKIEKIYKIYNPTEQYISEEAIRVNHYLYFVSKNTTDIYEFDIDMEKLTILHTKIEERGLNSIYTDGKDFYLTGFKNCIYHWNRSKDKIVVINLEGKMKWLIENDENKSARFGKTVCIKNLLLFIPQNSFQFLTNELVLLDRTSDQIKMIDLSCEGGKRQPEELFIYCFATEDEIIIQDYKRKELVGINIKNGEISYKKPVLNRKAGIDLWKNLQHIGGLYAENDFYNLENFVQYLAGTNKACNEEQL